jgi:hypothetical protein
MATDPERIAIARALADAMRATAATIYHMADLPEDQRDPDLIARLWRAHVESACAALAPYLRGPLQ